MKPRQDEYLAAQYLFGATLDGPAIQNLGRVLTRPYRAIAFPNVLQHRVSPFSLKDPAKPGHRKILALFLVDPHTRILSTSNVPPQRRDWWAREVRQVPPFSALPQEVFDQIIEGVEGFPMSWEEACAGREKLMEERGKVGERIEEAWNEVCTALGVDVAVRRCADGFAGDVLFLRALRGAGVLDVDEYGPHPHGALAPAAASISESLL